MKIFNLKISSCPFWDTCTYEGLSHNRITEQWIICLSIVDDIVLQVDSLEEHKEELNELKNRLLAANLKL